MIRPDALTSRLCTPPCGYPSIPQLLVGALLRHHRSREGLAIAQAGQLLGIPVSRVRQIELARQLLSERFTRSLLEAYDAPEEEVEQAAALVAGSEGVHLHEAGAEPLGRGAWEAALKGASRETAILTTGPLQPVFRAAAAVVARSPHDSAHRAPVSNTCRSLSARGPLRTRDGSTRADALRQITDCNASRPAPAPKEAP
ncbi:helix-turn-helix transcriptional regulator [Streptomyces misionensis]|uniref:helix-turn-helix domain-containing protein n=1 Tax=Streptomyces misionensis TaxID=67331 RepID=UPI00342EFDB0